MGGFLPERPVIRAPLTSPASTSRRALTGPARAGKYGELVGESGSRYIGDVLAGRPHGQGQYFVPKVGCPFDAMALYRLRVAPCLVLPDHTRGTAVPLRLRRMLGGACLAWLLCARARARTWARHQRRASSHSLVKPKPASAGGYFC